MRQKPVGIIFLFFCLFFLIFFAYTIFNPILSQDISVSLLFYYIGKLAGLIGLLFLSILIISGDTARYFDRFFGMDKIIKFQRKFSLIATIFVISHPFFFMLSSGTYLNYLIPNLAVLPLALGIISLYIYMLIIVSSVLYKRISYCAWQYIHLLTYILFFFSLYHAFKTGSDMGNKFIQLIFGILLLGAIVGGIYRIDYKLKNKQFKCHVREIKWGTPDVFTLKLNTNRKLNFKPGQFCFLRINKDKLHARHPFTISSSPNEYTLDFTMKMTGRFTKIASQLNEGEEVIVDGPFGIFTIEDERKDLVFIAGGIGITPFISMIKGSLHLKKQRNITLIYSSKIKKEIMFKKELDELKEEWLKKVYVLSREEKTELGYEYGRITREIVTKHIISANDSLFYVCGPESFKDEMVMILRHLGAKKSNIKVESFFW